MIVLFASSKKKSSTPATAEVFATVIRPSSSIVNTGICVGEPYVPATTPVFASSVVISTIPLFDTAEPVTFPVRLTVVVAEDNVSRIKPSAAISRPSTRPVTTMSPFTVRPVNSSITVLKIPPSAVSIVKVLFEEVQYVFATPATDTVFAEVMRPSSSTVMTGTKEAEPYVPAVTPVFASSVIRVMTPVLEKALPVTLPVSVRSKVAGGTLVKLL